MKGYYKFSCLFLLFNIFQIWLLLVKVSLNPMIKIFTILERTSICLECGMVESLKVIFLLTSCQPNWQKITPQFLLGHLGTIRNVSMELSGNLSGSITLQYQELEPEVSCSIIGLASAFLNTFGFVFFAMTSFVRFYQIVIMESQPTEPQG